MIAREHSEERHLALVDCDETAGIAAVAGGNMVTRGRVRNGVVVLENGVRLPEGQEVMVLAPVAVSQDSRPHGILDIPPVSAGAVLRQFSTDDDLLDDMLQGRS
jgi:hypothetical protein